MLFHVLFDMTIPISQGLFSPLLPALAEEFPLSFGRQEARSLSVKAGLRVQCSRQFSASDCFGLRALTVSLHTYCLSCGAAPQVRDNPDH